MISNESQKEDLYIAFIDKILDIISKYLKTVEEVYNSLIKDKEVQAQIEKIKAHEWVKIVEGNK